MGTTAADNAADTIGGCSTCATSPTIDMHWIVLSTVPSGSSRSIAQEVVDVFFPPSVPGEVLCPPDATGLQDAGGVSLLQRDGEPRMPSTKKSDWAPGAEKRQLRRPLARGLSRTAKEIQRLRAPTPERLDGEGDKAAPRKREGRVPGVFALGGSLRRKAVPIGSSCKPGGGLRVRERERERERQRERDRQRESRLYR